MDGYVTRKQHLRGKDIEKKNKNHKEKFYAQLGKENFVKKKKRTMKGFHTKILPLVSNYSILDTTLMDSSCSNIHPLSTAAVLLFVYFK